MVYTTSNFNNEKHATYNRIGLIPYTIINDEIYLMMGIDRKTREYTDFGGRINKDESDNDALLREYVEESRMTIPVTEILSVLNECARIDTADNKLMFIPVKEKWYFEQTLQFPRVKNNRALSEIIGIKWINEKDFSRMVFTDLVPQYLWNKIKSLVATHYSWHELKLDLTNVFFNNIKTE